jgi:predicted phage terminase large subunit-like protein
MYLLDIWRRQAAVETWVESLADMVHTWKPMAWAEELVQITSGVGPYLNRRLNERRAYVTREQFPTRGDKGARAQSIRARMATNGLYVPVNKPWYEAFRSELLAFPTARHDDQVDTLGLIGQLLDKMIVGRRPAKDKREVEVGYYYLDDTQADTYAQTGSLGVNWSETDATDYSTHWKAI